MNRMIRHKQGQFILVIHEYLNITSKDERRITI